METDNSTPEVTPNSDAQQLVTEPPKKHHGFLLPIIGVFLLLVLVGVGAYYIGSQNNQDASTQKSIQQTDILPTTTPTNSVTEPIKQTAKLLGLTFSLPKGWYYPPTESCIYSYNPANGGRGAFASGEYKFCLHEYTPEETPKSKMTVALLKQILQNQNEKNVKFTELTVNELPVLYYKYGQSIFDSGQPNKTAYIFSENGSIGQFSNVNPVSDADKYYTQVLDSFRSTN